MVSADVFGGIEAIEIKEILEDVYGLCKREEAAFKLCILSACHNDAEKNAEKMIEALNEKDVLLINADEKQARKLLAKNKAQIITFGLNSKACVTASSVIEDHYKTVQCCIQRKLPTFSGNSIDEQEFSINIINRERSIHAVLACVTAALVSDIDVAQITGTVIC